jgi:outer membrane receptor for ferrienterochelin and colicins
MITPPSRIVRALSAAVVAAALAAGGLAAQTAHRLDGRVTEAGSDAPLQGAAVQAEGPVRLTATTDAEGRWSIAAVPAGRYVVRVRRMGFVERTAVVDVPAAAPLTLVLTAGALPLNTVVVTASRRLQRLADVPVTTEVITRAEIEQAGVSDLSAVLTSRLGIQLEGGHPAGEGVMLQGLSSERVLILMDGQPMVGRISGQIDLSRIPASMVERVEVVKGPQSALYGSEAMGGVVNVITRRAAPGRWDAGLELTAGTQGRADVNGSARGTLGRVKYVADLGRRSTELTPGRSETQDALAERLDGMLRLEWAADSTLRMETSAIVLDERQRWRGGPLYQFADNRQWSARAGAEWTRGASRVALALYISEFQHLARAATGSSPVEGSGDSESQRMMEGELLFGRTWGASALDAGVEARREEIDSDRVRGRDRAMHSVEPFAQTTFAFGAWQLVPGARMTWSEQWGTHFTPRLAAMVRPIPSLALRGSVGRGFRAPAFKELYMNFLNLGAGTGYTVQGNPELRPESSSNVTLGAEWAAGPAYLRGQVFYNRFTDFIETALAGDSSGITVYTYDNVADGFTRGAELEAGATRGRLRTEIGYGYLATRDEATGAELLGRPAHSGRLSLDYTTRLGPRAGVTAVYTGRTPVDRDSLGAVRMREGFPRLDARIAQTLPRGLEFSLGVRNLTGAGPADWPGYTGRHVYAGIGWRTSESLSR